MVFYKFWLNQLKQKSFGSGFVLLGLLSFVVYLQTLAPTITWRNNGFDSGDLAAAVAVGGVPHPPGYPTYLLLGEIFKLLPIGDIAYRLNLLSAVSAAVAISLVGLAIWTTLQAVSPVNQVDRKVVMNYVRHEEEKSGSHASREFGNQIFKSEPQEAVWLYAAGAALTLAFSSPFWSQAIIAEVHTLNVLFAISLLTMALHLTPMNQKWIGPALFAWLGLGLGNHLSLLLLVPWLFLILSKIKWSWFLIATCLVACCLGISIYLLIPIRALSFPPVNWGAATTWPAFLWLVSAAAFRQFFFTLPWEYIPARLMGELHLLLKTFMWGVPIGLLGLRRMIRLNSRLACGSVLTFSLISIYAIGYNTSDSHLYLLPALVISTLWLGWGLCELTSLLENLQVKWNWSYLVSSSAILLPLLTFGLNVSTQEVNENSDAYIYAQQSLELVAPGAIIVTEDDPQTFALWYARYGTAIRPDVAIVNGNLLVYPWYHQTLSHTHPSLVLTDQYGRPTTTILALVESNLAGSSVYLATGQSLTLPGYRLEPAGPLQRIVTTTP